jgi:hypothetical protein
MVVYHREDINGDPFFVGDRVVISRPAGNNSSRLDIVRVVRFTAKGVTTELDREPKSSWETKMFNTPYRKEKFLKLK